jgi:hypothetical protein
MEAEARGDRARVQRIRFRIGNPPVRRLDAIIRYLSNAAERLRQHRQPIVHGTLDARGGELMVLRLRQMTPLHHAGRKFPWNDGSTTSSERASLPAPS